MSSNGRKTKPSKGRKSKSLKEKGLVQSDGRTSGRPKGSFLPKYQCDWELAESYYVQGMIVEEKRGTIERRKPSYADVARKFKVSKASVAYHAKKANWQKKREKYDSLEKEHINHEVAKARAISFADGEEIVDRWISKFEQKLEEGDVRVDSIADLERAMRTKAFLRGQAESRVEMKGAFTLDSLADIHRQHRERFEAEEDEEQIATMAGVLVEESPGSNDGTGEGSGALH